MCRASTRRVFRRLFHMLDIRGDKEAIYGKSKTYGL